MTKLLLPLVLLAGCVTNHAPKPGAGAPAPRPVDLSVGGEGGAGGDTAGGAGGTSGSDGAVANADLSDDCGKSDFKLKRVTPDILVVLDRSASMTEKPSDSNGGGGGGGGSGGSKWEQVTGALDPAVKQYDAQVHWGIQFFPTDSDCKADAVAVPVKAMGYSEVSQAMSATKPGGLTPTAEAITLATMSLSESMSTNDKYILLATDGAPTCGDSAPDRAIAAVKAAADKQIKTIVLGISTDKYTNETLDKLADAGQMKRPGGPPWYYPVNSGADLTKVIDSITQGIISCSFPLSMTPPDPLKVRITIGTKIIPRDLKHTDGWDYTPDGKGIELFGATCDGVKTGSLMGDIHAQFGCPPIP